MGRIAVNKIDLVGSTFGRLTVLGAAPRARNGKARWACRCACGKSAVSVGTNLRSGHTASCGCVKRERVSRANKTHGLAGTRPYKIWSGMHQRCHNPKSNSYHYYGARGISVCEEWGTFEGFLRWLETSGYADDLSIDRVNNDGDYEPSNCRWATPLEQAHNRRPHSRRRI